MAGSNRYALGLSNVLEPVSPDVQDQGVVEDEDRSNSVSSQRPDHMIEADEGDVDARRLSI